jgi:hypothetical protein
VGQCHAHLENSRFPVEDIVEYDSILSDHLPFISDPKNQGTLPSFEIFLDERELNRNEPYQCFVGSKHILVW